MQITKEMIDEIIAVDDELEVLEESESGYVLFDACNGKDIPVHFIETMVLENLMGLIHVSKDIPKKYRPDESKIVEYLWHNLDRNMFITLEEIVIVWSDTDNESFVDMQRTRLYQEYNDEYAYEIGENVLGQMWFDRNIIIINMGEIVKMAKENEQEFSLFENDYYCADNQVIVGFLTTLIHELRHLQMDTNYFLPVDEYPENEADEDCVELYCRQVFEKSEVPTDLFVHLWN